MNSMELALEELQGVLNRLRAEVPNMYFRTAESFILGAVMQIEAGVSEFPVKAVS